MDLVAGDVRDGQVQCDCADGAYQHDHVGDLKSATTFGSTFHKLAQYPDLNISLHIDSDEEGDGYFYKGNKLKIVHKEQATEEGCHDYLYDIESEVAIAQF